MEEQIAPSYLKLTYSAEQIEQETGRLGQEIGAWAKQQTEDSGQQVLAVCILRGALFFFADLLRQIPCSVEYSFCRSQGYIEKTRQLNPRGVSVFTEGLAVRDRTVLLVDDICDTGATLSKVEQVMFGLGAKEVASAVLVRRDVGGSQFMPTWSAFEYPGDEWFVGYGFEDENRYRNLRSVYVIQGG